MFLSDKYSTFHVIAHDHRIAENTANDRQRLYGNTFQRSGDRQRLYRNTFQRSGRIVIRERSYASVIPAIRRSWAIIWKLGFTNERSHSKIVLRMKIKFISRSCLAVFFFLIFWQTTQIVQKIFGMFFFSLTLGRCRSGTKYIYWIIRAQQQ